MILSSIKAIKKFANFDSPKQEEESVAETGLMPTGSPTVPPRSDQTHRLGLNLAYTINLNLPATSDIAVFNAIFKSLKENLLKETDAR